MDIPSYGDAMLHLKTYEIKSSIKTDEISVGFFVFLRTCRFVWLCDVLQIDFDLKPDVRVELTDKEKLLIEAQREADLVKEDKLLEYKTFLEKERENFEKLKKETVDRLRQDLARVGFDDSMSPTQSCP